VVPGEEVGHRDPLGPLDGGEVGQELADQQVGGRLDADVDVVAHLQPLARERGEVDRAAATHHLGEHRPDHVAHQAQPLDRRRGVHPEPGGLARALVDGGEGTGAALRVLDHLER
jgi:hypothetical protein